MKQLLLASASMLVCVSSLAFAQSTPAQRNEAAATSAATEHRDNHANLRQELSANLRQAGFTDIRIVPDSFLVEAKDKSGNPVTMFINPHSMEMVTRDIVSDRTNTAATDNTANMNDNAVASSTAAPAGMFTSLPAREELSSKVVGLSVYNDSNQDIGKIKDIAFDRNGVKAYIVAVGGFLGMGDHYVAVKPSAVHINRESNSTELRATMNTNADQLKAAPEYKYSRNS